MTWLVLIQHGRESGLDLYTVEMDGPDFLLLSGQLGADSLHGRCMRGLMVTAVLMGGEKKKWNLGIKKKKIFF